MSDKIYYVKLYLGESGLAFAHLAGFSYFIDSPGVL